MTTPKKKRVPIVKDRSLIDETNISADEKRIDLIIKRVKLSDVFGKIPHGHVVKSETGMGATTLELNSERNSIIVEPLKITASAKAAKDKRSIYVGSATKERGRISDESIQTYCKNEAIPYKKILVVADSLPRVIKLIKGIIGNRVYSQYFLMIDEIDSFQLDSGFREKMEQCIDIYKKFKLKQRALVSATKIDFSDPELQCENRTEIYYEEFMPRTIEVFCTNDIKVAGLAMIVDKIRKHPDEKIMVAYNYVAGCRTIADKLVDLGVLSKEDIRILCGEGSQQEVGDYYSVLLGGDKLPAKVCFFTSAYFSGFDLNDDYHLISISGNENRVYTLSENRIKQIAGRCRQKLLSEAIVHDVLIMNKTHKKPSTLDELVKAANIEIRALTCIDKNYEINPLLKNHIDQVRSFILNHTTKDGYQLVRRSNVDKGEYVISYFNIDAYFEHVRVQSLYINERTFSDTLYRQGHEVTYTKLEDTHLIIDDSDTAKSIKKDIVKDAISTIRESSPDVLTFRSLSKDVSSIEKSTINAYLDNYEYIDNEHLLKGLEEVGSYKDSRKLNKFIHAMYYESLDENDTYKRAVKLYLSPKTTYSNKELLERWNLILAEAGLHHRLDTVVKAVRLAGVYFKTNKLKKGRIRLISENPRKLKVLKRRKISGNEVLKFIQRK